ncbi:aldolase [Candidatus Marsarchaeota G1 archaeon BE_D]|uniref:Aldolase n=1 Tax=Candidatus Marsarchaeota G1 archaeon BE_D TaxID=1978156 RepID=A0A2R6AIY0_9ARCH|nr:MAG: aldolase [Candidatus Marsarchaeota G1 archaeon BE_D]
MQTLIMRISLDAFMTNGRSLLLAYDQGLEHGPTDFNELNYDPSYILDIAAKGGFNGIILQKGIAEKYYDGRVPLILKVNGKTNLFKGEPISRQICSVEEAISLGAKAVGYTIYLGSEHEHIMFQEFGRLHEEAHKYGLPVIAWIYPRGAAIKDDTAPEIVAYAARAGLELGADAIKIKYTGSPNTFSWAVKNAGKVKVYMSGGPKAPTEEDFLRQVQGAIQAGAVGLAVGRNVWQSDDPLRTARKLKEIVIENKILVPP